MKDCLKGRSRSRVTRYRGMSEGSAFRGRSQVYRESQNTSRRTRKSSTRSTHSSSPGILSPGCQHPFQLQCPCRDGAAPALPLLLTSAAAFVLSRFLTRFCIWAVLCVFHSERGSSWIHQMLFLLDLMGAGQPADGYSRVRCWSLVQTAVPSTAMPQE